MGKDDSIPIHQIGCTALTTSPPQQPILLKNVIHAPHISKNLISVS